MIIAWEHELYMGGRGGGGEIQNSTSNLNFSQPSPDTFSVFPHLHLLECWRT